MTTKTTPDQRRPTLPDELFIAVIKHALHHEYHFGYVPSDFSSPYVKALFNLARINRCALHAAYEDVLQRQGELREVVSKVKVDIHDIKVKDQHATLREYGRMQGMIVWVREQEALAVKLQRAIEAFDRVIEDH